MYTIALWGIDENGKTVCNHSMEERADKPEAIATVINIADNLMEDGWRHRGTSNDIDGTEYAVILTNHIGEREALTIVGMWESTEHDLGYFRNLRGE